MTKYGYLLIIEWLLNTWNWCIYIVCVYYYMKVTIAEKGTLLQIFNEESWESYWGDCAPPHQVTTPLCSGWTATVSWTAWPTWRPAAVWWRWSPHCLASSSPPPSHGQNMSPRPTLTLTSPTFMLVWSLNGHAFLTRTCERNLGPWTSKVWKGWPVANPWPLKSTLPLFYDFSSGFDV